MHADTHAHTCSRTRVRASSATTRLHVARIVIVITTDTHTHIPSMSPFNASAHAIAWCVPASLGRRATNNVYAHTTRQQRVCTHRASTRQRYASLTHQLTERSLDGAHAQCHKRVGVLRSHHDCNTREIRTPTCASNVSLSSARLCSLTLSTASTRRSCASLSCVNSSPYARARARAVRSLSLSLSQYVQRSDPPPHPHSHRLARLDELLDK
jgi:hypothetical protein